MVDQPDLSLGGVPLRHRGLLDSEFLVEMQPDELVDHDADRGGLGGQLGEQEPGVLE